MKLTDWMVPEALRQKWKSPNEYFPVPHHEMLYVLYDCQESRMMLDTGKIAVVVDKKSPKILLQPSSLRIYMMHGLRFSADGEYAYFVTEVDKNSELFAIPFVVFRHRDFSFAFFPNPDIDHVPKSPSMAFDSLKWFPKELLAERSRLYFENFDIYVDRRRK